MTFRSEGKPMSTIVPHKALSVRQPWAWAITRAGKDIENRDWKPWNPGLKFRGAFLLHASSGMTRREYREFREFFIDNLESAPPEFDALDRGGIVAIAEVTGVTTQCGCDSLWFFGPYGLQIANVQPTEFLPCKGALGFFDVPDDVHAAVRLAP
jgi:hypothetical protein